MEGLLSTGPLIQVDTMRRDRHAGVMVTFIVRRVRRLSLLCAVVCLCLVALVVTAPGRAAAREERWQWPTRVPVAVVDGFAPPAHDWLPGRRGVTLRYPAPSPVYACASGTVTVAGNVAGRGVISIRHSVGARTIWSTYLPVTPSVAPGDHVAKGDLIGVVEGDSPTLHWGAKTGPRTYVDPLRLTVGHPRLLPWDGAAG